MDIDIAFSVMTRNTSLKIGLEDIEDDVLQEYFNIDFIQRKIISFDDAKAPQRYTKNLPFRRCEETDYSDKFLFRKLNNEY